MRHLECSVPCNQPERTLICNQPANISGITPPAIGHRVLAATLQGAQTVGTIACASSRTGAAQVCPFVTILAPCRRLKKFLVLLSLPGCCDKA